MFFVSIRINFNDVFWFSAVVNVVFTPLPLQFCFSPVTSDVVLRSCRKIAPIGGKPTGNLLSDSIVLVRVLLLQLNNKKLGKTGKHGQWINIHYYSCGGWERHQLPPRDQADLSTLPTPQLVPLAAIYPSEGLCSINAGTISEYRSCGRTKACVNMSPGSSCNHAHFARAWLAEEPGVAARSIKTKCGSILCMIRFRFHFDSQETENPAQGEAKATMKTKSSGQEGGVSLEQMAGMLGLEAECLVKKANHCISSLAATHVALAVVILKFTKTRNVWDLAFAARHNAIKTNVYVHRNATFVACGALRSSSMKSSISYLISALAQKLPSAV